MTPDRLSLIERRWREASCGDGDKAWLLEEVKRLRAQVRPLLERAIHDRLNGARKKP